jgi:Ca-activated chloride channel family protein
MKWIFATLTFLLSMISFAQTSSIILGNQFYKDGQFEQAEMQYRKALETEPENTTALYNLSNALHRQKKYEDAAKVAATFYKATKDTALKSAGYYNEGVSYSKLNNLEASIESYKNALRLNPNDKESRENLQKALLQLKNKQQKKDEKKQKQDQKMSQKEAEQKLKQLQQKEKELQEKMNKKTGGGQTQDW